MPKIEEPVSSGTFAPAAVILIFFGIVGYSMYFDSPIEVGKAIIKEIKQFEAPGIANTIEKYNINKDRYDGETVVLRGFLERSVDDVGAYGYFVVDDFNNKVRLEVSGPPLELIPQKGRTEKVYTVSGVGRREYEGLVVVVENISL